MCVPITDRKLTPISVTYPSPKPKISPASRSNKFPSGVGAMYLKLLKLYVPVGTGSVAVCQRKGYVLKRAIPLQHNAAVCDRET